MYLSDLGRNGGTPSTNPVWCATLGRFISPGGVYSAGYGGGTTSTPERCPHPSEIWQVADYYQTVIEGQKAARAPYLWRKGGEWLAVNYVESGDKDAWYWRQWLPKPGAVLPQRRLERSTVAGLPDYRLTQSVATSGGGTPDTVYSPVFSGYVFNYDPRQSQPTRLYRQAKGGSFMQEWGPLVILSLPVVVAAATAALAPAAVAAPTTAAPAAATAAGGATAASTAAGTVGAVGAGAGGAAASAAGAAAAGAATAATTGATALTTAGIAGAATTAAKLISAGMSAAQAYQKFKESKTAAAAAEEAARSFEAQNRIVEAEMQKSLAAEREADARLYAQAAGIGGVSMNTLLLGGAAVALIALLAQRRKRV